MRSITSAQLKHMFFSCFAVLRLAGCLLLVHPHLASAQNVRIVSGALRLDEASGGANFFQPVVAPVVVAPPGKYSLADSGFDPRGFSRHFSATANAKILDVSLTYDFLFPIWRGRP